MENKRGSLSTVFLVIAIILIVVMGVFMYMQKIEADRQISELQKEIESISNTINSNDENVSDKTENNEIKNEDVLGEFVYEVPQQIKDEFGHYYDGITIKLLENDKFEYYHAEGFLLKGIYSIDKSNIICNATTEEGEFVEEHKINDKYTFKYENNMLELIKYEGNKSEQGYEVYERIGSKYVKNIASSENSSDIKYSEITKTFGADERFFITEAINNNDDTFTLKGVVYEKFTLTKSQLEDAVKNGGYKYKNIYETNSEYVNYTVKKNYEGYDYAFIGNFNNEDRLCFYASQKDNNTYYIQNDTEYSDVWNLTDEYKQITVSNDTKCEYSLDSNEFKIDTVKNVFSKKLYFGGYFNFTFENGKCTSVEEMIIGH